MRTLERTFKFKNSLILLADRKFLTIIFELIITIVSYILIYLKSNVLNEDMD